MNFFLLAHTKTTVIRYKIILNLCSYILLDIKYSMTKQCNTSAIAGK